MSAGSEWTRVQAALAQMREQVRGDDPFQAALQRAVTEAVENYPTVAESLIQIMRLDNVHSGLLAGFILGGLWAKLWHRERPQ